MDYIREAENRLRHYADCKKFLKFIEREIEMLIKKGGPKDLKGMDYSDMPKPTSQFDEAYNQLFQIQMHMKRKKETEEELNTIDEILNDLDDNECQGYREILTLWYIDKMHKDDIAEKFKYSRASIYDLKARAIRKFAIRMFGLTVVESI